MENATHQEGWAPASAVVGMPVSPGGPEGCAPGAEQAAQAAPAGMDVPAGPAQPEAAPGAPAEHACSCGGHAAPQEPKRPEAAPQGPQYASQYGAQYAAPLGPQAAPQYASQYDAQYGARYAAPQGPQAAWQYGMPQGPGYASAAQHAAPQGPQPQAGPDMGAAHGHEDGEGHKGHCHGHHQAQTGEPRSGLFGFPGFGGFAGMGGAAGPQGEDPKHMEYRYGQMMELCNDLMQGKADPSKIAAFLTSTGAHFWKGAIVGAAVTFLLTNSAVKSALGDAFSAVFGADKGGEA